MMMVAAAQRRLTLAAVNLWQTGIRSLFKFYQYKSRQEQDQAWADVRAEVDLEFDKIGHRAEEWEYQTIRAILYEELNCTVEMAEEFYRLYPESTPLLDALKNCIVKGRPD